MNLIGKSVADQVFENNGNIHLYSPGAGTDNPLGSYFLQKHKYSNNYGICCEFFPLYDFVNLLQYFLFKRTGDHLTLL